MRHDPEFRRSPRTGTERAGVCTQVTRSAWLGRIGCGSARAATTTLAFHKDYMSTRQNVSARPPSVIWLLRSRAVVSACAVTDNNTLHVSRDEELVFTAAFMFFPLQGTV